MGSIYNADQPLPPHITSRPVTHTSVTNASIAATDTGSKGSFFDFTAMGADVYIIFGPDTNMGAATTSNGTPIPAGTTKTWWIPQDARWFRAITAAGTCDLAWNRSS